jgi:hypothetical protein
LELCEKGLDPLFDAASFNELKRIVLSRIAELELPESIQTANVTETLPESLVRTAISKRIHGLSAAVLQDAQIAQN